MGATPFVSPSAEESETEDIIKGKKIQMHHNTLQSLMRMRIPIIKMIFLGNGMKIEYTIELEIIPDLIKRS